jgi:hypothetical protein
MKSYVSTLRGTFGIGIPPEQTCLDPFVQVLPEADVEILEVGWGLVGCLGRESEWRVGLSGNEKYRSGRWVLCEKWKKVRT